MPVEGKRAPGEGAKPRRFPRYGGILLLAAAVLAGAVSETQYEFLSMAREYGRLTWRNFDRRAKIATGQPLTGTPDLERRAERLRELGFTAGAPVFIRIFKEDHELELWMKKGDGFALFATYPVCTFSGGLGPKLVEGDRQAPEGFYTVGRGQMNAQSKFRKSFNLGYPNAFDAAHGRTGSALMVHGRCSSIGCYAMTDPAIDEIWALTDAALSGGQERFSVQVFPFRMTSLRLRMHSGSSWMPFWMDLKQGYDLFETSHVPPRAGVCRGKYVVEPGEAGNKGDALVRTQCLSASSR
jgi:murein L,D-transpeptidase YafK